MFRECRSNVKVAVRPSTNSVLMSGSFRKKLSHCASLGLGARFGLFIKFDVDSNGHSHNGVSSVHLDVLLELVEILFVVTIASPD